MTVSYALKDWISTEALLRLSDCGIGQFWRSMIVTCTRREVVHFMSSLASNRDIQRASTSLVQCIQVDLHFRNPYNETAPSFVVKLLIDLGQNN